VEKYNESIGRGGLKKGTTEGTRKVKNAIVSVHRFVGGGGKQRVWGKGRGGPGSIIRAKV